MNLLDPIAGGKIRAVLTIAASTFAAVVAVTGDATTTWAQVVLIVLAALMTIVQTLTHGTDIGDVPS